MNTTKFAVTGTTHPLVDGQPRNITLVAIVTTENTTEVRPQTSIKQHGKRKITTVIEDTVIIGTTVSLAFGLAVVSPADLKAQREADNALATAKLAKNEKLVKELLTKTNIVSPARGEEVAYGKASKPKSRLALVTVDSAFFTKHMIKTLLNEKLKHVITNPNLFIRIAPPKDAAKATKAVAQTEEQVLAH